MKRLVVCFDGTWNNPEQEENGVAAPTNVVRLYHAVADADDSGVRQLEYYHPGVGGEELGLKEKILGGALGRGVERHLCSGYHWLAERYEPGDEIYIFGFSRGAFTARSLGGFLGTGMLDLRGLAPHEAWHRTHQAFAEGYRRRRPMGSWAKPGWAFFHDRQPAPVHMIGVWDTVGALGIPDDLEIINLFDRPSDWQFHDTELGAHIQHARHAMAIDEMRSSFTVTRWANAGQHADAVELWFPGVHSDVGGGYGESDLSNGALKWMLTESEALGLCIRDGVKETILDNPNGALHDSYKGLFAALRSRPRNIPAMVPRNRKQFHQSALTRQEIAPIEYAPYFPTATLEVGEQRTVDVFADTHWNRTGLFLSSGHEYRFSARGEWKDKNDACDWRGTEDGKFTKGDLVRAASSFLGRFETLFKEVFDNESSDFLGTKRVEEMPWFTMVGAIANDSGSKKAVTNDGSPTPHQYVELAQHTSKPLKIARPGYLYCFANDVWSLYGNNRGSIELTVKRTA